MRERFPAVYSRGGLGEFTLKQRITIRIADLAFYSMIRVIGSTLRYETEGEQHFRDAEASGRPCILALWHDRIFASAYFFRGRGIAILTSKSMDGEYIARFLTRLGLGAVRGSSSRGGVRGLVEMIRLMREGVPMAITADGPRGPRYVAKSGPVMLAKKTGNPIVPLMVECEKFWTINSWDKLQIPKPFSRARVHFSESIFVADERADDEIEADRERLQTAMDKLAAKGETWRKA